MNDATRLRIRRELAERMGYFVATGNGAFWLCFPSGESVGGGGWATEEDTWNDAPAPYESAADKDALVEWLAADDVRWAQFEAIIRPLFGGSWRRLLSAPREIITDAAWLAIQEQQ